MIITSKEKNYKMKKILNALSIAVVLAFGAMTTLVALPTYAVEGKDDKPAAAASSGADKAQEGLDGIKGNNNVDLMGSVRTILSAVFVALGVVAVVVIIIGGINYTISQGDPGKVKKAKDTILYGIVGLVISLSAFAIVQFVLNAMK